MLPRSFLKISRLAAAESGAGQVVRGLRCRPAVWLLECNKQTGFLQKLSPGEAAMSSATSPALATGADQLPPEPVIFGTSALMRDVYNKLDRLAGANVAVLVTGESGTGKEIIANLLHRRSPWSAGPFVKVNC